MEVWGEEKTRVQTEQGYEQAFVHEIGQADECRLGDYRKRAKSLRKERAILRGGNLF